MSRYTKPIVFVSYNSRDFLINILNQLIAENLFSRCACWYHEGIDGKKNHFHCWCETVSFCDTVSLEPRFVEIFEDGSQGSIAFDPRMKTSGFVGAYLYGVHDNAYLQSIGKVREKCDIVSDKHIYIGDFSLDIAEANIYRLRKCLSPYARLKELVWKGYDLEDIYETLRIPFHQFNTVARAYKQLKREYDRDVARGLFVIDDCDPFEESRRKQYTQLRYFSGLFDND